MTVHAYALSSGEDFKSREAQREMLTSFSQRKGFGPLDNQSIHFESERATTPLDNRSVFTELSRYLRQGDILLLPRFDSALVPGKTAGQFLRVAAARGIRIYIAELDIEATALIPLFDAIFAASALLEAEIANRERALVNEAELHAELLLDYGMRAVRHASEKLAKADIGGAIRDALLEASAEAAERKAAKDESRSSTFSMITPAGRKKLARTHPELFASLQRAAMRE